MKTFVNILEKIKKLNAKEYSSFILELKSSQKQQINPLESEDEAWQYKKNKEHFDSNQYCRFCKEKAANNHSIPEAILIKFKESHNGQIKLLNFSKSGIDYYFKNEKFQPYETSKTKNILTFYLYCSQHDSDLFQLIENKNQNIPETQFNFLYFFKAISYQNYSSQLQEGIYNYYEDKGKIETKKYLQSHKEEWKEKSQLYQEDYLKSYSLFKTDKNRIIIPTEKELKERDFNFKSYEIDLTPEFLGIAVLKVDKDIEFNKLTTETNVFTVFITLKEKKTFFGISWFGKNDSNIEFLNSIEKLNLKSNPNNFKIIIDFLIKFSESWIMSPDLFESKKEDINKNINELSSLPLEKRRELDIAELQEEFNSKSREKKRKFISHLQKSLNSVLSSPFQSRKPTLKIKKH